MVLQWGLALALTGCWLRTARPFTDLGIAWPQGASWWWTAAICAAVVGFFAWQAVSVAGSPDGQAKVRAQLAGHGPCG
jgi:hypothetical protein